MSVQQFKDEINLLLLTMRGNGVFSGSSEGTNIIQDMDFILQYQYGRRDRRYLTWGLCIGRSVDTFTKLFCTGRIPRPNPDTFGGRIHNISNHHTTDPTLRNTLDDIRILRNDLFHEAGRYFTQNELHIFFFNAIKGMHQLLIDL